MKRFLLLLVATVMLQSVMVAQTAFMAPAQAELNDNQRILGHYDSDAIATEGVAIANATGKNTIGVILEAEEIEMYNTGKIVAFRVGLAESTPVTKVFVQPVTAGGAFGTMIQWNCEVSEVGWNVVELPSPYVLALTEGSKLMIGFEYEQTSTNKPLALVQEGTIYDTYRYKKAGGTYRWTTAGLKSHGNLCVQCIVEKDNYPETMIKPSDFKSLAYVNTGDDLPYSFMVKNRGNKVIDANVLSFDVKVDGEKVGTIRNAEAIEPGAAITMQGVVETGELVSGSHTLTIDNAMAGDEVLDYVYPMNFSFKVMNGVYPRQKHVIEQLTSTYCTYCPLGNSMLSIAKELRDDIIWVGLHGNLGSGVDPYTTNQGDSIMIYMTGGAVSYPSAAFDRSVGWESPSQVVNSIGYYEEYHQECAEELCTFFDYIAANNPSFASINIDPVVNLETREATITVSGEMSPDIDVLLGDNNKLTVYLTEDSLVARQLDNGAWVSKYVHNGVFRCALGTARGVDFNKTADGYSNVFTVTVPEAWNINNLNVVAFIGRPLINGASGSYTDLSINNAESVRLVNQTGGVEESLIEEDIVPVGYYDITGRQIDGLQQGINIIKMSNGTARKVLVK